MEKTSKNNKNIHKHIDKQCIWYVPINEWEREMQSLFVCMCAYAISIRVTIIVQ